MSHLHETLSDRVNEWKKKRYQCDFPAVQEILEYVIRENYLRTAQVRALEVYLYLRCVEGTPHIRDLYASLFTKGSELQEALGIPATKEITGIMADGGMPAVLEKIAKDEAFAKKQKLEALHETLTLDYPSYILALAMGAGKTILIGSIVAVEFALAMEYPDGPFIANALVFAPGKTILESLRELSDVKFEHVLPARLLKSFLASVKMIYTRDGEKDIPIIRGSRYNMIVTNTEKIRIQKAPVRQGKQSLFARLQKEEEAKEVANLRLQAIASLPHLGIFSDEAHHLYGQEMEKELKQVRKTVDYLNENTNVLCVVNTTGTPYYQKQFLRDVIVWYSLGEGIQHNILKEVAGSIYSYPVTDADTPKYIREVIRDFIATYDNVSLPNGSKAKIALYFPQQADLQAARPLIEKELVLLGKDPSLVLVNTEKSSTDEVSAFNNLSDPSAPHRIILLVNKGTEGWNCPSLFACALIRKLTNANNFVLQASTRCMRQVVGNTQKARIYLSHDNRNVLETQLKETYGATLADLDRTTQETRSVKIIVRKTKIPPLVVKKIVRSIVEKKGVVLSFRLKKPTVEKRALVRSVLAPHETSEGTRLESEKMESIAIEEEFLDAYAAAIELSGQTHLPVWGILEELKRIYGSEEIPHPHLPFLLQQLEKQTERYEVREEEIEEALALLKLEGFTQEEQDGETIFTAEIRYPKHKENLLLHLSDVPGRDKKKDFGFHYDPYNFDSAPEKSFFESLLSKCGEKPENVADIYFTGGLTSKQKTDFAVEYQQEDKTWHAYTPDFLIRMKNGKCLIVEVKQGGKEGDPIEGKDGRKAMAIRQWENLDSKKLKYEMVFSTGDRIADSDLARISSTLSL